ASPSAAPRSGRSPRGSPSWWGSRPAPTAAQVTTPWPGFRRAWPSGSPDRSGIEKSCRPVTTSLWRMDITIHASFLPHTDPEASLRFYRDALGFEVRKDVGYENMRWLTVGPPSRPDTNIVLYPPTADPGITEEEGRVITEMIAKGTFASIMLATGDVDAAFEQIQATGAEVL